MKIRSVEPITNNLLVVADSGETVQFLHAQQLDIPEDKLRVEILNDEFVRGGSGTAQFVLHNTGNEPIEIVTSRDGGPSDEIRFVLERTDGVELSSTNYYQTLTGPINRGDHWVVVIEPGESFTSVICTNLVPANAPDDLVLRLEIDTIHWHTYDKEEHIEVNGIQGHTDIRLVETTYAASINSIVPQKSLGNEDVLISGVATNRNTGAAMANTLVRVALMNDGVKRDVEVYTDQLGNWSYRFRPLANDGGYFTAYAVHPDVYARPAWDGVSPYWFTINRMQVTPSYINLNMPRNYQQPLKLKIHSLAGQDLQNISVELYEDTADNTNGFELVSSSLGSLAAGGTVMLNCSLLADNTAQTNGTGTLTLRITGDANAPDDVYADVSCIYKLVDAKPVLTRSPSYIETGVAVTNRISEAVTLKNIGFTDLSNVQLSLSDTNGIPAPSWVYLTSAATIDRIESGESIDVGVSFYPPVGTVEDGYEFRLNVEADYFDERHVPIYVGVNNGEIGGLNVHVKDLYTLAPEDIDDPDYEGFANLGVSNATVQLVKDAVIGDAVVFRTNALTGVDGTILFSELPTGSYKMVVTADRHEQSISRIWIKPGVMSNQEVTIANTLVTVAWSVQPTTIQDKYEIVLESTFEMDVPAPVVVLEPMYVELPDMEPGETYTGEYNLSNYGNLAAQGLSLTLPPTDSKYKYEFLKPVPDVLKAHEIIRIPFRVTKLNGQGSQDTGGEGVYHYSASGKLLYITSCDEVERSTYFAHRRDDIDVGSGIGGSVVNYNTGSSGGYWLNDIFGGSTEYIIRDCPGDGDGDGTPPSPPGCEGDPDSEEDPCEELKSDSCEPVESSVYLKTGVYADHATDISRQVLGYSVSIDRYYSDHWGWRFGFPRQVRPIDVDGDIALGGTVYERVEASGVTLPNDGYYANRYMAENGDWLEPQLATVGELDGLILHRSNGGSVDYDADGYLTAKRNRNGVTLNYIYTDTANGKRLTEIQDHFSNTVFSMHYDENDRITSITDGSAVPVTVTYEYDTSDHHNLTNAVDVTGIPAEYTYDDDGLMMHKKKTSGIESIIVRDVFGRVASIRDQYGKGKNFEYYYDSMRLETYALVVTTDGEITERWWDASGALINKLVNGDNPLRKSLPDNPNESEYIYDDQGNLIRIEYADGSFRSYENNGPYGELTLEVNEVGVANRYAYDSRGNMTNQVLAVGTDLEQETRFVFDEFGLLREQTLMNTNGSAYVSTLMVYDAHGNLTNQVLAAGTPEEQTTSFTYDELGNLMVQSGPAGSVSNLYNAVGQLTASFNVTGQMMVTNVYNVYGQLERSTDLLGRETRTGYDDYGNADDISVWVENTQLTWVTREYDPHGRVVKEIDKITGIVTSTEYSEYGNKDRVSTSDGREWNYEYDEFGRLVWNQDDLKNESAIVYDPVTGLKDSVESLGIRQEFEYDLHRKCDRCTHYCRRENQHSAGYLRCARAGRNTDRCGRSYAVHGL